MNKYFTPKLIAKLAVLSSLAAILFIIQIQLPFIPMFYAYDLSDIVALIGGFALGPLAAVLIQFFKIIISLFFRATQTAFVGEFANFLCGSIFAWTACMYYKQHKTKKGAMIGMVLGTIALVIFGAFINAYFLLPFFARFYGNLPMSAIIEMGTKVNPYIDDMFTFILFANVPLNVFKGIVSTLAVLLVYKRVSVILKK